MTISLFDLFSIGIGPSSSHTVGPMRAAHKFTRLICERSDLLTSGYCLRAELYGSLALTGKGHGTDIAIPLGFSGELPDTVDPERIPNLIDGIRQAKHIRIGQTDLNFDPEKDLVFHYNQTLSKHANGMRFTLLDQNNHPLFQQVYYSIGGGFFVNDEEFDHDELVHHDGPTIPFPYKDAKTLLALCDQQRITISEIVRANERCWRNDQEIDERILMIWQVMSDVIDRGCQHPGILPGGLKVKRRAAELYQKLSKETETDEMNWINLYALAVNEENAAGGRVVTAPTNGAAGIIPAVLKYYTTFCHGTEAGIIEFMLTAMAIGILYKEGASISAAEMGCQGEVGVACSMAAAGLCAALGGTIDQIENAAEIGMEHNLGLTCDPVKGLVQIPCIERNAMGAVQAINTAKLALMGDGEHHVSLDAVIKTMRETGEDMKAKYKETSQGGLALNQTAC